MTDPATAQGDTGAMTQTPTLQLDERQRAMLEAMHIKVWQPLPATRQDALGSDPVARNTTKTIADNAHLTGAEARKQATNLAAMPAEASPQEMPEHGSPVTSTGVRPAGVAEMTWPTLQSTVAECRACGLCEGRKNTVFGVGQAATGPGLAPQVDWLIVGEAPGENEDRQGEPFVGQAGKLLDNMLRAMGLSRHDNVFIANVLKCRPPGNRNPEPQEVAQCLPYLQRQIELLQPKVILAMGRFAIQALLNTTEPIGKLRERTHRYVVGEAVATGPTQSSGSPVDIPVIVTYHPAYLLRNLPEKAKAWADLCLAMDVMEIAGR